RNVIHRVAASRAYLQAQPDGSPRVQLGYTAHDSTPNVWNFSYTWIGRIEQATSGPLLFNGTLYRSVILNHPATIVEAKTEIHETIHIWKSTGGVDQAGHCAEKRYQDTRACLMHTPLVQDDGSIADAVAGLHYVGHGLDSEYLDIRRAADPFQ